MPSRTKSKTTKKPVTKSMKKIASRRPSRRQTHLSPQGERQSKRLLMQLPSLGAVLRGSLVTRYRRCGRPNCHCAQEGARGHGPAYYLMVTIAPGETVQVYVPKEQKQKVEACIHNFRRTREILERISTANRKLLKQGKLFKGG